MADDFKTGNPHVDKSLNALDASMFSGDVFFKGSARSVLRRYIRRWDRELDALDKTFNDEGEPIDG